MRFQGLDLNLLAALAVLLEEKSVSAAAQRLRLSQSAMSGALARLRETLHDELLVLQGRQMVLTPRAVELAGHVRVILQKIHADILSRHAFEPATSHRDFTIMASDYATSICLAPAIQRIGALAPSIKLDIIPMAPDPFGAMDRGEVGLVIIPRAFSSSAHSTHTLFSDRYVGLTWRGNDSVGEEVSMNELLNLQHISVQFIRSRSQSVTEWIEANHNCRLPVALTVSNYHVVPFLLIGTPRIAIIHSRLADQYAKFLPLKICRLPVEIPHVVEVLQWQSVNDADDGLMWVASIITETACALAPWNTSSGAAVRGAQLNPDQQR